MAVSTPATTGAPAGTDVAPATTGAPAGTDVGPATTGARAGTDVAPATADTRERAVAALESARRRTLDLLGPLDDTTLTRQHSRLMSPLVWDLAHIGNYEDLWLVRAAGGRPGVDPALDEIYDAFRHPRADRPALPLLGPTEARRYLRQVRGRALDVVEAIDFDPGTPLLAGAFVVGLVVQHEHQHVETMLATLQLMDGTGYRPRAPTPPPARPLMPREVLVPAGTFLMGSDDDAWAYDNERPRHVVDLPAFWIDKWPVTNAQFLAFIDDRGYHRPELWAPQGWAFRVASRIEGPRFWRRHGADGWTRTRFGWVEDVPPDEPVQHVSWFEADAFARWAGKRLPTEQEWEKAAGWTGSRQPESQRLFPWGDRPAVTDLVNLGGRLFRPAPVGSYPAGASPCGSEQMIGDVWEWTASDFGPYPGFTSFPYREYSEVFFGQEYKVLRGGSWATHPSAVRSTFRNWDYPIRRQIFAGVRCARDA